MSFFVRIGDHFAKRYLDIFFYGLEDSRIRLNFADSTGATAILRKIIISIMVCIVNFSHLAKSYFAKEE